MTYHGKAFGDEEKGDSGFFFEHSLDNYPWRRILGGKAELQQLHEQQNTHIAIESIV